MPVPTSGPLWRARRIAHSEWYAWWRRAPLAQDTVLWSSFDGAGMTCHPRALFDAIIEDPDYSHLKHVWVVAGDRHDSADVRAVTAHPRVSSVSFGSRLYLRALARSKYLVNNAAFPVQFTKRPGQVYLNTWHGLPLVRTVSDVPQERRSNANALRNFLQADYLLSAGPPMTRGMYEGAYRLGNIYPGTILEAGSPRMDTQLAGDVRDRLRTELARHDISLTADRVALVAPTGPMASVGHEPQTIGQLADSMDTLREALGPNWTVLLTLDPRTPRAVGDMPGLRGAVVPDSVNVNLVLGATDLLVGDHSSLVFDYLPRDRPVILLAPDTADDEDPRGFDLGPDGWPGPTVQDADGLASAALRVAQGHDDFADARRALRDRLYVAEDGNAARRVVDVVFGGHPDPRIERKLEPDGRTRLLLHLGGMKRNGITSSALNLLRTVDHERVDVTCFFRDSSEPERLLSAAEIDPRARILLRSGGFTATKASYLRARTAYTSGVKDLGNTPASMQTVFVDEWARCFGSAQFDRIADFSGYGAMWGLILLAGPAPLHGIWLHNEMVADSQRVVNGRRPQAKILQAVFSLYKGMDRLISVSPALSDLNRAELAGHAPPERFVYARNTLDFDRIDARAAAEVPQEDEAAAAVMRWLEEQQGRTIFVTAGRLSSEKNQERLIRAFAEVHRSRPETALLLLGDGVLRKHLEDLVQDLGLGKACLVAGFQSNPFQFMKHCSCFVLSSDHEGQPMVILEALHLGLQVITTRFSSVDSALPPGVGLVVDRDVQALAEGMQRYLQSGPEPVTFDSAAYNAEAVEEFYTALDIPPLGG